MLQIKSKRVVLLLCGCLLFSRTSLPAQESGAETSSKAMTEQMRSRLNLSDDQYRKVDLINTDFAQSMAGIKKADAGRSEKISQMKALSQKREASLKEVLTAEQFANFQEQKKASRKDFRARRRRGG